MYFCILLLYFLLKAKENEWMNSTRNTLTSLFKNKIKYTFSVGGNVIIVIGGDDNY